MALVLLSLSIALQVKFFGAYTAVVGGLNALIFTAGTGENASPIRLDPAENDRNGPRISSADRAVLVCVIPTHNWAKTLEGYPPGRSDRVEGSETNDS